jgi:nitrous oxide reductase accessory protein NosL
MRPALCFFLLLAACNRDEQPQPPTPAESDRLNDAESMLNGLANEEGPEAEAPDPSNQSD